jgi:hypothetical protein
MNLKSYTNEDWWQNEYRKYNPSAFPSSITNGIETVSADKFDARVNELIKNGYSLASQGDFGVVFQKKTQNSAFVSMILLGLVSLLFLPIIGISFIILSLIVGFCSGFNNRQEVTLRKS